MNDIFVLNKDFLNYVKFDAGSPESIPYYAQVLKIERINRNLTLQETAAGICSVSYLSKLENKNIDSTNESYVRSLCERFELNFDTLSLSTDVNLVTECVDAYFYKKYNRISEIYEKIPKEAFTSCLGLIGMFYYLSSDDFDSFFDIVKNIEVIKFTMCNIECVVYLYLVSEAYRKLNNHKKVFEILSQVLPLHYDDSILHLMVLENIIYASFHLKKYATLFRCYNELSNSIFLGYPEEKRCIFQLLYDISIVDEFPDFVKEDIRTLSINSFKDYYRLDILYYYLLCKCKLAIDNHDYLILFEKIEKDNLLNDERFCGLYAYLALKLNGRSYYRLVDKVRKENKFAPSIHTLFLDFVCYYASLSSEEQVIASIKENIILKINDTQHYLYNSIYTNTYCELLAKDNKYKEAYVYSGGEKKDLRNIRDRLHVIKIE